MKLRVRFLIYFLLTVALQSLTPFFAQAGWQADFPSGEAISIVLEQKNGDGKIQRIGLIRNYHRMVFTGPVDHMTEGFSHVHFFQSAGKVYGLFGNGDVLELPFHSGFIQFKSFELNQKKIDQLKLKWKVPFVRGIQVQYADGRTERMWVHQSGALFPENERKLIPSVQFLSRPEVREADFLSWHLRPAKLLEELTRFHVLGTTPSPDEGLNMALLEVRKSADARLEVLSETHAQGKLKVQSSLNFFGSWPDSYLAVVYHEFAHQKDRPVFDDDLLNQIRGEDRSLPKDRLVTLWATTGATPESQPLTVGGIRLFQGYSSSSFLSTDQRLPVERQYPNLPIRERFKNNNIFEFNRLLVRRDLAPWLNTRKLVRMLLQYMDQWAMPDGLFIIHTDESGAALYQRFFGAHREWGPAETRDGTTVLSVSRSELWTRVESETGAEIPEEAFRNPKTWCSDLLSGP